MSTIPEFDVDIFSDEVLQDPFPTYARMRELGGPVVRLTVNGVLAVARYAEVRAVFDGPHSIHIRQRCRLQQSVQRGPSTQRHRV